MSGIDQTANQQVSRWGWAPMGANGILSKVNVSRVRAERG